jgi:predicted metalloprotease with PDZ domain
VAATERRASPRRRVLNRMTDVQPIRYRIRLDSRLWHYVDVEACFPVESRDTLDIGMAVWTPGSYLIREYSRHIENVRAFGGDESPLRTEKTRKNRWRISTTNSFAGGPRRTGSQPGGMGRPEDPHRFVVVRYRVYGYDLSVRGNWIDEEFALINGAPTFLTLTDALEGLPRRHIVEVELPSDWPMAISPLTEFPVATNSTPSSNSTRVLGTRRLEFVAPDFDTLVDSPLVAGKIALQTFEAGGRTHAIVHAGDTAFWDLDRAAADIETVVREQQLFWGEVPYARYVFFNLVVEANGGLEHRDSTVLMTSRWKFRTRKGYLDWIGLVSHEFFHTWNVKRLRPAALGPFDYENEVYTRGLWVAEGLTTYYTDLLLIRAGLATPEEYLDRLSKLIERLQTTPGRGVQTLETSSYDAWIKLYRPDENSSNSSISYYVKGAVVGFLLDAKIRTATNDQRSLDDVLRIAFQKYSGERGFADDEFLAIVRELVGSDWNDWFHHALETAEELDYSVALDWFGLELETNSESAGMGRGVRERKNGTRRSPSAWLGIVTKLDDGKIVVSQVVRRSPSHESGISPNDELIAIDGYRLAAQHWEQRLEQYSPGDRVRVLVARRERLVEIPVELGCRADETWKLTIRSDATKEHAAHRRTWWHGE